MNLLAHLHIDFAAEPTGPGRIARRMAVALAVMAALGIAAVIWLGAENRRAQEQLAALLAARPTAGAAAPTPPQDLRLDAQVQAYLVDRAKARGIDVAQLVNELLKKDIELIEAAR